MARIGIINKYTMGQTCCNFSSKDPNAMSVNGSSISKMGGATKVQV